MNRRALAAGVLALVALAAAWLASPDLLLSRVDWLLADPFRFAVALCVLAAVRPLLAWPTSLLGVLAGYAYGLAGAPLALALITLTGVPPYLVALRSRDGWGTGGGRVSALTRRAAAAGERAVDVAGDFRSVAASRLLPTPSDAVSVGAGLAGVRFRPYLAGTAVGEVPWAVAATVAGASAGRVAADGVGAVLDPWLVATAALAGTLLLAGPVYRRFVVSRSGA